VHPTVVKLSSMLVVLAFVRYVLPFVCIVAGVLVFWLAPGSSRFVGAGA
jgi:hypothetical protein